MLGIQTTGRYHPGKLVQSMRQQHDIKVHTIIFSQLTLIKHMFIGILQQPRSVTHSESHYHQTKMEPL